MPRALSRRLVSIMGIRIQGDCCGFTCYVSRRHKIVFFPQAPPKEPPSHQQRMMHARWAAAARTWRHMPLEYQLRWKHAVKRAKIPFSGYSLFVAFFTKPDPPALATIERIARVDLLGTYRRIS